MASPARSLLHTFRDYVALEEYSNVRHEFRDGSILAMAGGTPDHAALIASITGILFEALAGTRCAVHSSDLRIRVRSTGLATYPDASVVGAPRELDPEDANTVLNPRVVVEVTSPGSEAYDRGEKREQYLRIDSLAAYLIVCHRERSIETWRRQGDRWTREVASAGAWIDLPSIGSRVEVDRVYASAAQAGGSTPA